MDSIQETNQAENCWQRKILKISGGGLSIDVDTDWILCLV